MTLKPEFSHIIKLSALGNAPLAGKLTATEDQRSALAKRFDLPAIASLLVEYTVQLTDERIIYSGKLISDLTQTCATSGEDFPARVDEEFTIAFVEKTTSPLDDEVELVANDCDVIEFESAQIDIGEAAAQTLYLALDPYPRGPNAESVARKKGLLGEEEAGPFGALAALKGKLT